MNHLAFLFFSNCSLSRALALTLFLINVSTASPCLANYGYVTNAGNDTVSVFDTDNNSVVATINLPVDSNCQFVAITPDGSYAYVSCLYLNTVVVINTSTNTIETTISGFTNPAGIAFSPDGSLAYVTNSGSDTVSIVNTSTHLITGSFTAASGARSIVITPDNLYAYVANYTDESTSVIDITNNYSNARTIAGGAGTFAAAISPTGDFVYVTHEVQNCLTFIQTSNNTTAITITTGSSPRYPSVTADGQYVYVPNKESGDVSVIATGTQTVTATITLPSGAAPYGSAMFADNNRAYITDLQGYVHVINTENNQPVDIISVGSSPTSVAIRPSATPNPPISLACYEVKNRFLTQADVINVITWEAASSGTVATSYIIYRDSLLNPIGEVLASEPLVFHDHNRRPNTQAVYYLKAVSETGIKSSEALISIHGGPI